MENDKIPEERCEQCTYYYMVDSGQCTYYYMVDSGHGECRRFPPQTIIYLGFGRFMMPTRYIDCLYPNVDWCEEVCGEFDNNKKK